MIHVVGIGLDGLAGCGPRGRRLIAGAEQIVGTARHLDLLGEAGAAGQRVHWDGSPGAIETLLAGHRDHRVVLLASGDPNLFGIGASLRRSLGAAAVDVEPGVSSLQLALARAAVPGAGTALLSAHGRPLATAAALAARERRAAILTDPGNGPQALATALAGAGVEAEARLVVCEQLGGPDERVREGTVGAPPAPPYGALAVVVLDRLASPGPGIGRPEREYEHAGGQVTKGEVRAIALAALDIASEDTVWDVGAGSGAVAIEAGRLAARGVVYAVERRSDRAEQARRNAASSWNVEVICGDAGAVLPGLPDPDAVFLGGGGSATGALVDTAAERLGQRQSPLPGRLVANLATLESVMEVTQALRRRGLAWAVSQISVARGRDLGGRLGWEALNPVHIVRAEVPRAMVRS